MSCPEPNTCPTIDSAKDSLERATTEISDTLHTLKDVINEELDESLEDAKNFIESALGELEDLREANQAIRNWGEEQEEDKRTETEELQEEIDNLITKNAYLIGQIADIKQDCKVCRED